MADAAPGAGARPGSEGPAEPPGRLPVAGDVVVAAGVGVTGLPVVRYLAGLGARVVATSHRPAPEALLEIEGDVRFAGDLAEPPADARMVITSAGLPPTHPLLAAAARAGLEVIGEAELAWRLDRSEPAGPPRPWLVVTGTNGKTTTTGMLEAMLRAAGRQVTACGNIGWPVLEAVLAAPRQDVIAVELSSFQLHWAPSIRPAAGLVLNLAEDHLDWHGSMDAYAAAKARALTGDVALAVVDDPGARDLLAAASARRQVPVTGGPPADGGLGVRDGVLTDEAFGQGQLAELGEVQPPGPHNVTNALAAAGLALAVGVRAADVAAGLHAFTPGGHRNVLVGDVDGVRYVDDSKATNPHAARASLLAHPRVVWVAGGQLKGAAVDELVRLVADRLAGAVLIGVDAGQIDAALSRHAPEVPRLIVRDQHDDLMGSVVDSAAVSGGVVSGGLVRSTVTDADAVMGAAVRAAAGMAARGDAVVLAPAAASLDMFPSYAARGDAFAAAVRELADAAGAPTAS